VGTKVFNGGTKPCFTTVNDEHRPGDAGNREHSLNNKRLFANEDAIASVKVSLSDLAEVSKPWVGR
jgi:hypothetical protein